MAATKFLDLDGLSRVVSKIKALIPTKTSDLTNDSGFITNSDLYFKSGDTYTNLNNRFIINGLVRNISGTTVYINLVVSTEKLMEFGTGTPSANVTKLYGVIAGVNGSVNSSDSLIDFANTTGYTIGTYRVNHNTLEIRITASTSLLNNVTKNTPVSFCSGTTAGDVTISFS